MDLVQRHRRNARGAVKRFGLAFVLSTGMFFCQAYAAGEPGDQDAASLLRTAESALDDGLWSLAEMDFRKLLDANVSGALKKRATVGLVRALCGQGRYDEAYKQLRASRSLAQADAWRDRYFLWSALALEGLGKIAEARRALERVELSKLPEEDRPVYLAFRARLLLAEGNREEAFKAFEAFDREYKGTPAAAENLLNWANALREAGQTNKMVEVLQRLARDYAPGPHTALGRLWLAEEYQRQNEADKARSILKSLVEEQTYPAAARAQAWLRMAQIELVQSNFTAAAEAAEQATTTAEHTDVQDAARWVRIKALTLSGEYGQAVQSARAWVAEHRQQPDAAARYLEFASLLLQQGGLAEGLEEYSRFLETFAHDGAPKGLLARAWLGKGWCLYRLSKFRAAADAFARAIELADDQATRQEALYKQADALFSAGDYDGAGKLYERYIAEFPGERQIAGAWYQLAECLARAGKPQEAQQKLSALIKKFPGTPEALKAQIRQCTLYEEKGDWDAAIRAYTDFLKQAPAGPPRDVALLGRGLAFYRRGDFAAAEKDFRVTLADFPERATAERAGFMLGWALYMQGRRQEALEACQDFVRRYPKSKWAADVIFWMAERYYESGDLERAYRTFLQIVREYPESHLADSALYWAGRVAMRRADYLGARAAFTELVEKYPDSSQLVYARFGLGDVLTELGQFDEAVLVFDEIVRNYSGHRLAELALGRKGDCLYTLGARDAGRYAEALKCYTQLLLAENAEPVLRLQARYKAARCHEKLGQLDTAFEEYMRIVYDYLADRQRFRHGGEIWFTRAAFDAAALKEREGKWGEALAVYKRVADSGLDASAEAQRRIREIRLRHWLLM